MPYVQDEGEEQLEGGAAVPGSGIGNAPQANKGQNAPTQKTPGRFADLSEYLRVNAPQNFGGQVAGKIGDDISKGQQVLDTSKSEFQNRVNANTVKDSQGLIEKVGTAPEDIKDEDYAKLKDATYTGPQKFSDTQDLYNQTQGATGSAVGKAKASKTEGGRFALLDNYFNRPTYTHGQKSLDNLLIQNDKNSQQAFDQMRQNAATLEQNTQNAGAELGQYGAMGAKQTADTRRSSRDALGIDDAGNYVEGQGAIGGLLGDLDQFVQKRQGELKDVQGYKDTRNIEELAKLTDLGDYWGSNTNTYGVDAANFLNIPDSQVINRTTAANTDQKRRMDALAKLADLEQGFIGDDGLGTYQDGKRVSSLDRGTLDNAVSSNKTAYESAFNPMKAKMDLYQEIINKAKTYDGGMTFGYAGGPIGQHDFENKDQAINWARAQMEELLPQINAVRNQYKQGAYVIPGAIGGTRTTFG